MTQIQAGQILLKKQFPLIDGLHDPSVKGHLVEPASTKFVQIVNVGEHWLCLTSIGVPCPGAVRVFDSLYRKPNATAAEHGCRILLHTGDQVMFINEKVQRQMGSSDCGLYALAFATDLCHGIDPTSPRSYDQALMRQHYVECLEKAEWPPFHQALEGSFITTIRREHWFKFFAGADCLMTRKSMCSVLSVLPGITWTVNEYLTGQLIQRESGNVKSVKIQTTKPM